MKTGWEIGEAEKAVGREETFPPRVVHYIGVSTSRNFLDTKKIRLSQLTAANNPTKAVPTAARKTRLRDLGGFLGSGRKVCISSGNAPYFTGRSPKDFSAAAIAEVSKFG